MKHTYTRICALLFIITAILVLTDIFTTHNQAKTDGPMIAVASPQKLPVVVNDDTTFVNLAKGDSVRIIGFTRLTNSQSILIETARGDRGKLDASQLPIKQIVTEGKHKGDTIVSLTPQYLGRSVHKYTAHTASGEDIELNSEKFAPDIAGWEDYNLDNNASTSVATQKSLEKCKGKTLAEIESKYGMAYNILAGDDGSSMAEFRIYAYGSDGKIYTPTIAFGPDGGATDFSYEIKTGKANNSRLLSIPFADMVISMPLTRILTRSDSYTMPNHTGKPTPWYIYPLFVITLVYLLVWYVLTPSIPVLLMGWLIAYPAIFRPLSNTALRITIIVVAILCTVGWMISLMAWGMIWFLTILVMPVSYFCFRWATAYLEPYVPHQRCPKCKSIETIEFDHDEVTGTKFMKGSDIKRDKLLDTYDEKYQSWTQVTKRYSDGTTTSHRENVHDHKRRHERYRYIDFEVTYLVTFYLNHFICSKCRFEENSTSVTQEEVDRKVVGSHTGVESHDVY